MVPAESAAALDCVGAAEQYKYSGIRTVDCAEQGCQGTGSVPGELLAQGKARHRERQERTRLRVVDPGSATSQSRCRGHGERVAAARRGGPGCDGEFQG